MSRGVRLATLALVLFAAGCPQDQGAGSGPLAGGYLANAKSLERALERLGDQLKSADDQLAAGSAHVSFEPLGDRDITALRGRLDPDSMSKVEEVRELSRALERGLDQLSRIPAREKPSAEQLAEMRALCARAIAGARAAREQVARFIAKWS